MREPTFNHAVPNGPTQRLYERLLAEHDVHAMEATLAAMEELLRHGSATLKRLGEELPRIHQLMAQSDTPQKVIEAARVFLEEYHASGVKHDTLKDQQKTLADTMANLRDALEEERAATPDKKLMH